RLDRGAIKALLAARRAQGLSKNTVRLIRATLSVMMGDAIDAGLAKVNPAQGLTRRGRKGPDTTTQSERQKQIRPMTVEQLEAFLTTAAARRGEWTLFLTLRMRACVGTRRWRCGGRTSTRPRDAHRRAEPVERPRAGDEDRDAPLGGDHAAAHGGAGALA